MGGIYFFQSRWFDPALGRFIQADNVTPQGAQGLDRYAFVNNNPVNYVDPSGHSPTDPPDAPKKCDSHTDPNCPGYYEYQMSNFGWTINGSWSQAELKMLYQVALDIIAVVGSVNVMMKMFAAVTFDRNTTCSKCGAEITGTGTISINPKTGTTAFGVAHELGHIWDQNSENSGGSLSQGLQDSVGSSYPVKFLGITFSYGSPGNGPALAGGGWPSRGNDYLWNKGEDFANSFAGYIYPEKAEKRWGVLDWRSTPRGNYIANQIPFPWMYPYSY